MRPVWAQRAQSISVLRSINKRTHRVRREVHIVNSSESTLIGINRPTNRLANSLFMRYNLGFFHELVIQPNPRSTGQPDHGKLCLTV